MARLSPFQSLMALLLAALMPFCCCDLHTLTRALGAGGGAGGWGEHAGRPADEHACCGTRADDSNTTSRPDRPGPRDQGPCSCGKDQMATIGAEKVSVDCSAHVLFAEMPGWAPAWIPHGEARTFDLADVQAGKPATSLLRLHCALTI